MLKMSDYPLIFYAKGKKQKDLVRDYTKEKIADLSVSPIFSPRQIALMFFILAHYITDAHMPLHCDLRDCGVPKGKKLPGELKRRLPSKLHGSIEERWEKYFPEKKDLMLHEYLTKSIKDIVLKLPAGSIIRIDKDDKYKLSPRISGTVGDEWREMVYITRTSYAVSRKLIDKPYKDAHALVRAKKEDFEKVTNCIFHDAVESVARLWLKAWERFTDKADSSADTSQSSFPRMKGTITGE
jgi:hypothetical protein